MTRLPLPLRFAALVLVLGALHAPAFAEDDASSRTIGLPRADITLPVPAGWNLAQYGDAILELERDGARIWIREAGPSHGRAVGRTWSAVEGGGMRADGLVRRTDRPWLEVEVVLPAGKEERQVEIDRLLEGLETKPYQNPDRHVDWNDGWTLDLPPGFVRMATPRGIARFEDEKGSLRIEVEKNETGLAWSTPALALAEVLARLEKEDGVKTKDTPTVEQPRGASGSERVRVHLGLNPDADGRPTAWLHANVAGPWRAVLFARTPEGEAYEAAKAALDTFREGADPGPRVGEEAGTRLRFEKGGPPVSFVLPAGWSLKPPGRQMRLAEWTVGGDEKIAGVVYYFGAGGGGPIDDNLVRWKSQMGEDVEAETEVVEVAMDVKAHVLDAKGAYSPGMVSGNPHGREHGKFRMLAAVLEVPEGPLFLKLVGPEATIAPHAVNFRRFVDSFRVVSD